MPMITEGELRAVVAGLSRPETWPCRVALARELIEARRERDEARAALDALAAKGPCHRAEVRAALAAAEPARP